MLAARKLQFGSMPGRFIAILESGSAMRSPHLDFLCRCTKSHSHKISARVILRAIEVIAVKVAITVVINGIIADFRNARVDVGFRIVAIIPANIFALVTIPISITLGPAQVNQFR